MRTTLSNSAPLTSGTTIANPINDNLGNNLEGTSSAIEIIPSSVEDAVAKIDNLITRANDLNSALVGTGWTGPGADAMGELSNAADELKGALIVALENTKRSLQNASDEFSSTDKALAKSLSHS